LNARNLFFSLSALLLVSCTSVKNTGGTRWYHAFNTRYNIYFNGDEAFKEAQRTQLETYTENYSDLILMHPVSALPKDKQNPGGPFDKSIEKAVKAIKRHSITTKPDKQSGKQNDLRYKEFMSRTEYNPFLHNAWMMMAKSQFFNGDFLQAANSFSYISRLYDSQPEIAVPAKIWKARCYSELGWYYEADDILSKINTNQLSKSESNWFSAVHADYLIKQKQYSNAIPYLKIAIGSEKNKYQRAREKYLLGQIYTLTGQKDLAYKSFGEVSSANAPYVLELNAKIRQTEVFPGGDVNKMSKKLNKMAKSPKNKDYLDQVYYALGNIYKSIPDTTKAVESYELGVEKSIRNGIDKALNQIQLGDIYFIRRNYLKAQTNYSEALGQLKKEDEAYPRVSKRSEVLDELVIHTEAVNLQDSLQRLSRMTEEERLAVVNKIIEDLIKQENEEKDKAILEDYLNKQEDLRAQQQSSRSNPALTMPTAPTDANTFYFYSTQTVALGKNAFQQKWGRRKLEDDWRRRTKSNPMSDLYAEANSTESPQEEFVDSLKNETQTPENPDADVVQSIDPKDPQFYLQQIPVTEEDLAASDLIISDGLFHIGVIYKDLLEDNDLALETLKTLDTRFPENENKLNAYYYTYLIYWQENNMEMANLYKTKIRELFPKSDLAIAMADPDYENNQKIMNVIVDSLYQQTYQSYLKGDTTEIRKNYATASTKYNQSKLMPKFMFIHALSFVQANEADTFKVLLKTLIDKYPEEDVSVLAGEMMKGFQRGLLLAASGDNMLARGGLFNMRFGGAAADSLGMDSALAFSAEVNTPHELLLVYPQGSINENLLLFTVASFNFGNFMVNDFDLEQVKSGNIGLLRIKGFNNQDEVIQYIRMISEPSGYAKDMEQAVIILPISTENYDILMKGKSLDDYLSFFEEHFSESNENLIAAWHLKQSEEMEVLKLPEEEKKTEEVPDPVRDEEPPAPLELPQETTTLFQPETVKADTIFAGVADSTRIDSVDKNDETIETINTAYTKASETVENVNNILNEIASDPIRGIQKLFTRKKKSSNPIDEYAKQQEKEEKERRKQLKKEQQEKEKAAFLLAKQQEKEQQELAKKQEEEEKALLKDKKQKEKDLAKLKEAEKKQKEADRKRLAKEKEDQRNEAAKLKKAEQKAKEKKRKEELKQKENARKEAQKVKEAERKAKEKARQEEKKRKAEERKKK
jgi:tetratricopeptide (TPR) repeat protein